VNALAIYLPTLLSVASAAEIGVSIKPILDALEALNARMVALENRPQPQQGCCVVS